MLLGRWRDDGAHGNGETVVIDEEDLEMPDSAIWRAAAEHEEEEAWLLLLGILQVEVEESPDRAAAVVQVAREFPSLAGADGLNPWDPGRLDQWMLSDDSCSTSGHWSAMLILSLWEGTAGQFPFEDARTGWDAADWRALEGFAAWRPSSPPDSRGRHVPR